ncbi:hypothetical protein [Limosilactobacillus caviae]|uniref:Uncharacterized protein n=1 Tax=Limosilactobacillus caviae TaxID=1769424 RepID=A0ABQ2C617_9LACO|nr:hypothetical protein [Limosilactobacillus caviae]GGI63806.1 hypothetical protein GCM10011459_16400 [Limosilactobacillus caviae]
MNDQKNEELRKAVEKVIGEKVDHFFIVASNDQGMELASMFGRTPMIAYPLAEIFKAKPELENQVEKAKKFQEQSVKENFNQLLKVLADQLGGKKQ